VCQSTLMLNVRSLRGQASLLQGSELIGHYVASANPMWERACSRKRWVSCIDVD